MNIVSNERLIKRNQRIAQVTPLAGMGVLVVGMVLLFQAKPGSQTQTQFGVIWVCILVGFVLTQVGIYFTNRWGRRPRPDEILNAALKGMDSSYSLYHYSTATSHLLTGPSGIWVLLPRYQRGKIIYEKNRWKQKGGGLMYGYLKIFGQESLGRPDMEVQVEISNMVKFFKKHMEEQDIPPIQGVLVFTDERAEIEADEAPVPTLSAKKLKEYIRKTGKKTLQPLQLQAVREAIEGKAEPEEEEPEGGEQDEAESEE